MLSDILTFVLALAVCGMAALCVYCYRLGLRDGMHVQEGIAPEPAKMPVKATVKRTDKYDTILANIDAYDGTCLLYTSPSPRDRQKSRMPSSA